MISPSNITTERGLGKLQAYARWIRTVLGGAGAAGGAFVGLAVVALLGLAATLAGGVVLLAQWLSLGVALLIGGAVLIILAVGGGIAVHRWHQRAMAIARVRLELEKRPDPEDDGGSSALQGVVDVVTRHPGIVAGAAFTAVTLLGPGGLIRLAIGGAKLAGAAGIATKVIQEIGSRDDDDPRRNGAGAADVRSGRG